MNRKQRYKYILDYFRVKTPVVTTELDFGSVFQLLCATLLSAQCTDKRVNMVTPDLFKAFPTAEAMSQATEEELLGYISSVSYPNAKARHLLQMSQMLVKDFQGNVPDNTKDLVRLPGVGRKTANVVQAVWFGKPKLAVDTHVFRVSHRMGLVPQNSDTPLKVEKELMRNIPKEDVASAHHWILLHGRYICTARKAKCDECFFSVHCPQNMDFKPL